MDSEQLLEDLSLTIHRALVAGVDWVQIREKDLSSRALLTLARDAVAKAKGHSRVLINDRLDVAVAARAGGVHLGEASLPVAQVAQWIRKARADGRARKDFLAGASCHSLESARQAEHDGADYIFFGPVFATPSKAAFGAPQGIEPLREVCTSLRIPVLAIGGITLGNARLCLEAGAAGIAAIRLFQEAPNIAKVVAALRNLQTLQR
jgi:thiamine-phosphate pyrophosphorylase